MPDPARGVDAVRVLIMAEDPGRDESRHELVPLLGAEGVVALSARLLEHAVEWARGLGADPVYLAVRPADAGPEMVERFGPGVLAFAAAGESFGACLVNASGRVFADGDGPVLVVWPELANLGAVHAEQALADLAAGADVTVGNTYDGRFYLLGLARPLPDRLTGLDDLPRGASAMAAIFAAAAGGEAPPLSVGLLRVERGLRTPADLCAARVDPIHRRLRAVS